MSGTRRLARRMDRLEPDVTAGGFGAGAPGELQGVVAELLGLGQADDVVVIRVIMGRPETSWRARHYSTTSCGGGPVR